MLYRSGVDDDISNLDVDSIDIRLISSSISSDCYFSSACQCERFKDTMDIFKATLQSRAKLYAALSTGMYADRILRCEYLLYPSIGVSPANL